jgi:hypothetical protein
MGILNDHHKVLEKLNTTGIQMPDKVFDYILCASSSDEKPLSSAYTND